MATRQQIAAMNFTGWILMRCMVVSFIVILSVPKNLASRTSFQILRFAQNDTISHYPPIWYIARSG
jgi:hypothetical protein